MPAIDSCEPQVIRAFHKAGWQIAYKPYVIRAGTERGIFIDLCLQHQINLSLMLMVEVKCFPASRSMLDEFYHAVGQYLYYRNVLKLSNITIPIYLTIPDFVFERLSAQPAFEATLKESGVKWVVVNLETEEIEKWGH